MRSITIRRYPSEAKFDAPTDFDKTLHQMSDTPIRTAEDALALIDWLDRKDIQETPIPTRERGCCTFLRPALEAVAHDPMRRPRQRLLLKFELVFERLGPDAGNPAGVRLLAISTALSG